MVDKDSHSPRVLWTLRYYATGGACDHCRTPHSGRMLLCPVHTTPRAQCGICLGCAGVSKRLLSYSLRL